MTKSCDKIEVLNVLKQYHDILVKINCTVALVKEYNLNFSQDSLLIEEVMEYFKENNEKETSVISEIYVNNDILKKNETQTVNEVLVREERSLLKNRKGKGVSSQDESNEKIKDITEEKTSVIGFLNKKKPFLDFSKSKKRKVLLSQIKENYTELLIADINRLLEVKRKITDA
ncbi:hypothetical protein QEN19_001244 [Hanseniaspora menglaensis]